MKAEIGKTGELKITAENNLESFALTQWINEYSKPKEQCEVTLLIVSIRRVDE